ncbi:glycylpeptide N-tetradecanoyltransferase [Tilletia horrida]|uniref:Glycylpeptide N-tetradecanoyltransferase n=1 Tax=Tilletia horrida TaxID=155126 RepID=A0AAN6JVW4_9BASI|nr:glycylpeptide N-tetradecanoyltransferase [Tilletia horrida]KAK0555974.1 glycylpeptide N-tetradecanoyltransferase [Tilletia horrida]KAK0568862.1 glycylpeptide N-tetradecanoyltransferase [Tilletia horrida]
MAPKKAKGSANVTDEALDKIQNTVAAEHGNEIASKLTREQLTSIFNALSLERDATLRDQDIKQKANKVLADHKFWKTQPVPKPGDAPVSEEGPIEPNVAPSDVRQEPYPLPKDFEWQFVDIDNKQDLEDVFELLSGHYVEDGDASLRFRYSSEFLYWVLKHPGFTKQWHLGVRVSSTRKLVGFISGIPHELRVREQSFHSVEINFLCVHKKLRSKRLAPVLIKEVTRQCHLTGIFQAIYTGGIVIPTPVSCARYYHRAINPKKLLEIGFSAIPRGMDREAYFRRYEVPQQISLAGFREMTEADLPSVGRLLRRYLRRYDLAPRFTDEEIRHILLSGRGSGEVKERAGQVTWTYVVEDPEGHITDLVSFYSLPSTVLAQGSSRPESILNAAYLFYYATDAAFETPTWALPESTASAAKSEYFNEKVEHWQKTHVTALTQKELADEENVQSWEAEDAATKAKLKKRLNELIEATLVVASQHDFDVLNGLTVMDNQLFLEPQKFGPGDGFLRYYLFNWRVLPIAGGMGNRMGEAELDPLFDHVLQEELNKSAEAPSTSAAASARSSGSRDRESQERAFRAALERVPKPTMGSGNGVVMV